MKNISTAVNDQATTERTRNVAAAAVLPGRSPAALRLSVGLLALPIALFLVVFFFYPALRILMFSFMTQDSKGVTGLPLTSSHYAHFFTVDLYTSQI